MSKRLFTTLISENVLNKMMQNVKDVKIPESLYSKFLEMGEKLAKGFADITSDEIKVIAGLVYYTSGNKKTDIFNIAKSYEEKGITENIMKRSELKGLIKEVVRLCVKESGAGAAYKVRKDTQVERPGLINRAREMQYNPEVNEDVPPTDAPPSAAGTEQPYDEQQEVRLIKAVGQAVIKLLQMHKGEESPEDAQNESLVRKIYKQLKEAEASYKVRDGRSYVEQPGKVNRAREMQEDPNVNESNHKVQHRSYKTIGDVSQNPENLRDPSVPST